MSFEPLQHIEAQDPAFPRFRQRHISLWLMWAGLTFVSLLVGGGAALIVAPLAMGWVLLQVHMNIYHRQQVESFHHYRQLEALTSLFAVIKIRFPLPPLRLWVVSPDFATIIVTVVKQYKPKRILELGSGTSTVICGYALESSGHDGELVSLEHLPEFVESGQRIVDLHGFSSIAEIRHAPLKSLSLGEETYNWYAPGTIDDLQEIDLLIVDGPPESGDSSARYPALPMIFSRLADNAIILVDDYMRPSENEMVNRWLVAYDIELLERIPNEKGAAILRKRSETGGEVTKPADLETDLDDAVTD